MLLLITRRARELAELRLRMLKEGMLVVVSSATSALEATSRDRFDAALIDLASYGKRAASLALALRQEGGVPAVGALLPQGTQEDGSFANFSVGEDVHVFDIVDYLNAMSGYTMRYRVTDRIAGIVRVKAEENRAFCALVPIDLTVQSRAMLSLLVHRYPKSVSLEDLMEICFRPLGVRHPSAVSRTAKRINELFDEYFLPLPISYERGKGYFLSYRDKI